jgi:hypothetical protein
MELLELSWKWKLMYSGMSIESMGMSDRRSVFSALTIRCQEGRTFRATRLTRKLERPSIVFQR